MPAPPTSRQQQNLRTPANTRTTGSGTSTAYGGRPTGTGGDSRPVNAAAANASRILNSRPSGTGSNTSLPVSRPFSYAGPKGAQSLNQAARFASVGGVGTMPATRASAADLDRMARMMLAESGSIRNPAGGISTPGLQGVAEVIRNRVLSERFPNTVPEVLNQRNQFTPVRNGTINNYGPSSLGYQGAYDVASAVMSGEQAPTVGNSLNYANLATVNNPNVSQASDPTKRAFNAMTPVRTVVSAANPALQHSFGSWGNQSDVNFANAPSMVQPASLRSQGAPQGAGSSVGGMLSDAWGGLRNTWNSVQPQLSQVTQQINSLPGTPEQKAAIVSAYAKEGQPAATAKYIETLMKGLGGSPFDYGNATPQRAAEERNTSGGGQTQKAESNIQKLTPEQQLEVIGLEPQQRVLLDQYMKSGMTFEQAMKVIRGGGQTADNSQPPAPWQFPTMMTRPYTRIG